MHPAQKSQKNFMLWNMEEKLNFQQIASHGHNGTICCKCLKLCVALGSFWPFAIFCCSYEVSTGLLKCVSSLYLWAASSRKIWNNYIISCGQFEHLQTWVKRRADHARKRTTRESQAKGKLKTLNDAYCLASLKIWVLRTWNIVSVFIWFHFVSFK